MFRQIVATSFVLAALSSASTSPKRARDGPALIRAAMSAHEGDAIAEGWSRWRKRQAATNIDNQRAGTAYTIDLEIGTPPQNITVQVDTGSVNLWVNPDCANSGQESYCDGFSQFDYTQSSTIEDTGVQDDLSYGKGEVIVEYVTDVVTIGSASITGQVFGIGIDSTDIPLGILGLSPPLDGNPQYTYVLDSMVQQGLIDSRAFSLDLRDVDSPDGALIFGGVDTGKFVGPLAKCPILDPSSTPSGLDRYWISMTYVGVTDAGGSSGLLASGELPVFLDSGGTLSRLPTDVFQTIGDAFAPLGAQYDAASGFYIIDCDVMKQPGSVDFGFGDTVISVSFENFIWASPSSGTCALGVLADDSEPVLGDSFLRAAYVVYDQDNGNIHLAQAANCGSNLVAISSGADAVPSSTGDCTGATATAASSTLSLGSAATVTAAGGDGGLTSAVAPGPEGTAGATSSGKLCLTCSQTRGGGATKTEGAGAKTTETKGAAAPGRGEGSPFAAAVGVAALAAWLV